MDEVEEIVLDTPPFVYHVYEFTGSESVHPCWLIASLEIRMLGIILSLAEGSGSPIGYNIIATTALFDS